MKRYELIALDMDGTLLDAQSEISPTNLQALRDAVAAGKIVCLATGRGIFNVRPYVEQIGCELPIVAANGSEIWERQDRLSSRTLMDADHIVELREWALHHDIWYWATASEQVFNKDSWCEDPYEVEWLKFGYYTEDLALLEQLQARADATGRYEITNSHPANLEFNPRGVHKAAGVEAVCRMYGLNMEQVIAAGDSLNDLSMIRAAGLGVAMGNAQEEVKRNADLTTFSNDEDGVAHIIRTRLLKQA